MDLGISEILLIVVVVAVQIAIILLVREIVCWYFKINERLKIQQTTLQTMLKIYEQNGGEVDWKEMNKIIL